MGSLSFIAGGSSCGMILSDDGIRKAIKAGDIEIDPLPSETSFTTSAVDLTLGKQFQGWNLAVFSAPGTKIELNLAEQKYQTTAKALLIEKKLEEDGSFIFPPYKDQPMVLLANTRERVHLKREAGLAARVEGRSSLARLGVMVHLTAPTIHCGFAGHITLELINHSPFHIRMVPGVPVCQLIVERLDTAAAGPINTAFQNQNEPSGLS